MKKFLQFFFQGALIIAPIAITIYVLALIVRSIDQMIPVPIPGLGFVIVIAGTAFVGFFASQLLMGSLLRAVEAILTKTPVISAIYSSVKDFIEAFIGNNKKFTEPVRVDLGGGLHRVGFLTRKDLTVFDTADLVAVYIPHSYNFSGNLLLVQRNQVHAIHVAPGELMRFIVSGGVTGFEHKKISE
ncbi:MAG: DUF502 domain-containing protein [Bdellovibrionales bacterium]|nr:DUF502 domain-containing protein [Bdellovibrionales bacterium]